MLRRTTYESVSITHIPLQEPPTPPQQRETDCSFYIAFVQPPAIEQATSDQSTIKSSCQDASTEIRPQAEPVADKVAKHSSTWEFRSCLECLLLPFLTAILLIGAFWLTHYWVTNFRGGFTWNANPSQQFNWHPLLMIGGLVTLSGSAIVLYRFCRCLQHYGYVKLAHGLLQGCSIPCVVIGLLAVYESKRRSDPPQPNFYSLHSWLGAVTMGLFVLQFVFGFFSFFVCLCFHRDCQSAFAPIHASFGLTTFMLACASCLTGLTQKAIYTLGSEYAKWTEEGVLINTIGGVIIALAVLIAFVVRR